MTNLEFYKERIKANLDGHEDIPCVCSEFFRNECSHKNCNECQLNFIDWLCEEHKEPIRLKQWEYDLMSFHLCGKKFCTVDMLMYLKKIGHYKSVSDTSIELRKILDNCIIVADDYEGFEECK